MKISIKIDEKATRISEKLYGIFFEDINYGGDGGLYAELVPNRAFEWVGPDGQDNRLMRWQAVGDACALCPSERGAVCAAKVTGGRVSMSNKGSVIA